MRAYLDRFYSPTASEGPTSKRSCRFLGEAIALGYKASARVGVPELSMGTWTLKPPKMGDHPIILGAKPISKLDF